MTDYPNGLSSMGVPVNGLMTKGNSYFVDPMYGSNGNTGTSIKKPVKTLAAAWAKCVSGHGDVIYLMGHDNTSANTTVYLSSSFAWNKDNTHLIGLCAPSMNPRARIAQLSTATGVDGMLAISGNGCMFINLSIFQGVPDATSMNAITLTGDRNYFENVHVKGMCHATMAATAASPVMTMTGAGENRFKNCSFGEVTVQQSAATYGLNMTGDNMSNVFEDCLFVTSITSAAAAYEFVHIANDGLLVYNLFKRCTFINAPDSAGGVTSVTSCFTSGKNLADYDGEILLQDCYVVNADQISSGTAYAAAGHGSGTYGDASTIFLMENPT